MSQPALHKLVSFLVGDFQVFLIHIVIRKTRFIRFRVGATPLVTNFIAFARSRCETMSLSRRSIASICFVILVLSASLLSLSSLIPIAKAQMLYDSGNPTPEEQLVLEYINRARANPVAEGQRLGIDITEGLQDDPSNSCYGPEYVGVRPPLAMNPGLLTVAEAHSEDMYKQNYFSHTDPNGTTAFQRISDSGYNYISAGENIGAGTGMSATDLEDLLMVDSGYPCRAHRMNLLDIFPYPPPAYYEVGIGYYEGSSGQAFITQDFGTSASAVPLLTGVVYNDAEGKGFYDVGEGISGVTITPSSGDYYAISSSSGGYAFPIPSSGTITVTASGNGFGPISKTITLTGTNVELDFTSQDNSVTTVSESTTQTTAQATSQTTTQLTTSTFVTQQYQTTQTSSSTTPALLETINFQSSPTNFVNATSPASITACGNTPSLFNSASACTSNFGATANLPTPATGWMFDHWTWAGGVACASNTANPVDCSAYNSGGVLIAVYAAQVRVLTNPASSASVNWGSCSTPGVDNGGSFFSTDFGSATVTACNLPSGYSFQGWTCTGGLTCEASTNPTTVTFSGPGSVTLNLESEQSNSSTTSLTNTLASTTTTTTAIYTLASTTSGQMATTTESTASVASQPTLAPIPGFPWESILVGILLGLFVLVPANRRRE